MIKAKAHSDDFVVEVKFDATRWFETVSDQDIINLIECDFGGDYAADDVVRFFIESNTDVAELFEYFDKSPTMSNGDSVGFECHVDSDNALEWLKVNRPHLLKFAQV
jgi:hypothetical protein